MGSNDLHRFWECEMDVGHAVNIQRIHLESCMRHSSCYDKTLANTSGLRSKNTDLASRYFFCGPERCRILYMYIIYVQIPECDTFRNRTRDGAHCAPPRIRSVTGCVHPPRTVCAPGWRSPQNRGFRKNPKNPVFGGQTGYLNNR